MKAQTTPATNPIAAITLGRPRTKPKAAPKSVHPAILATSQPSLSDQTRLHATPAAQKLAAASSRPKLN
jgi:hypothetical protein